jgi:hypothetical protein
VCDCDPYQHSIYMVVTDNEESGFDSGEEAGGTSPHPRKAAGAQINGLRHAEVETKNSNGQCDSTPYTIFLHGTLKCCQFKTIRC